MTRVFLLLFTALTAHAAVIRGTVAEQNTGSALARTLLTLQPLTSPTAEILSTRANDFGNFEFTSLPAGAYLVRATRRGFLPLEYGQRQWNSAGTPIVLTDDGVTFLNIRLHRPGAITGAVLDSNDIGLASHEVSAYRNTEPPQLVSKATSDDRGMYRISGLEPGVYLVRTSGAQDHLDYIPTFAKQTQRVEDAQPVQVYLDEDAKGIDVHPAPGKLFTVSGFMQLPEGSTIQITLASDMGRRIVKSAAFNFTGLPPGAYELYAEGFAADPINKAVGAYVEFTLNKDLKGLALPAQEVRDIPFDFSPRAATRRSPVQVFARRKDLAGVGETQPLTLSDMNRAPLAPGRWELLAAPPAGQYVNQFSPFPRRKTRPEGWNEISVQSYTSVRIGLSGSAGTIHGVVKSAGAPVDGAPVFLEAWDPYQRVRQLDLRSTRAGAAGQYTFDNLAPGVYRVMSSFEYLTPDPAAMELAAAKTTKLDAHADLQLDLDLYGVR